MAENEVKVTFRGQRTFTVDRVKLAENMQRQQRVARHLGLRPGEPTGEHFPPNNDLSSDVLAVGTTILYDSGKPT